MSALGRKRAFAYLQVLFGANKHEGSPTPPPSSQFVTIFWQYRGFRCAEARRVQDADGDLKLGRRAHPRVRLLVPARLTTLEGSYAVRLDNLSRTGAHLSRPRDDAVSRGILQWFEFEAYGEIVWQRLGYCGMEFENPLDESWVDHTMRHAPDLIRSRENAGVSAAREWVAGQTHIGSER